MTEREKNDHPHEGAPVFFLVARPGGKGEEQGEQLEGQREQDGPHERGFLGVAGSGSRKLIP